MVIDHAAQVNQPKDPRLCEIWVVANTTWYLANFRTSLIKALLAAGYRVRALSPTDAYVSQLKAIGVPHRHLPLYNASTNPIRELLTVARLVMLLREARPALLLTFTPKANMYTSIAASRLGIAVIANIAGLGRAFVQEGWLNVISRLLYRIALRHPKKVFFQNREDLEIFVKKRLVPKDRVDLLPGSGVDVDRFAPVSKSKKDRFVFLFLGRLLADKGIRELVDASRILRAEGYGFECRVLGFIDGGNPTAITENELTRWDAEGVIRYLGASDDVVPELGHADCVVLPSYYREGCPRSLLEAASMAIPMIAADNVGCREVVTDGENGFLCRARDVEDLAAKMRRMMALSDDERAAFGNAGRTKMMKYFDERIVISRYLHEIRKTLGLAAGEPAGATVEL